MLVNADSAGRLEGNEFRGNRLDTFIARGATTVCVANTFSGRGAAAAGQLPAPPVPPKGLHRLLAELL